MDIEIKYTGEWPCLCMGQLNVIIDGVDWDFGSMSLSSGGCCSIDSNTGEDYTTTGPWEIYEWPKDFPEDKKLRRKVLARINDTIPWGCCGGCI